MAADLLLLLGAMVSMILMRFENSRIAATLIPKTAA